MINKVIEQALQQATQGQTPLAIPGEDVRQALSITQGQAMQPAPASPQAALSGITQPLFMTRDNFSNAVLAQALRALQGGS